MIRELHPNKAIFHKREHILKIVLYCAFFPTQNCNLRTVSHHYSSSSSFSSDWIMFHGTTVTKLNKLNSNAKKPLPFSHPIQRPQGCSASAVLRFKSYSSLLPFVKLFGTPGSRY